jgi:hypothetical protein
MDARPIDVDLEFVEHDVLPQDAQFIAARAIPLAEVAHESRVERVDAWG